jgi:hypothetical protein
MRSNPENCTKLRQETWRPDDEEQCPDEARDDGQDKALTKVDLEVALPVTETILGRRVRERVANYGWAGWSSHPKAGRFAARFRVGTRLLPDLVLFEDKTAEAVE